MRTTLMVVILVLTSLLRPSLGDYKFEVFLESYSNPEHRLADGSCCDSFYNYELECLKVVCKNIFTFCVRPYKYLAKTSLCPSSGINYTTSVIASDKILFKNRRLLDSATNTSNPLVFYGTVWPGQVQLYVQVYNWNVFGNQLIDDVIQIWSLPIGSTTYSPSRTFSSQRGHVTMKAKARVTCIRNYYGPFCSTYCGVKGCSPLRATCSKEKECVCLPGFSGPTCEITVNTSTSATIVLPLGNNSNPGQDTDSVMESPLGTGNLGETELLQSGAEQRGRNVDGNNGESAAGGRPVGRIVGGVVGGVLGLTLLLFFVGLCLWCRRKRISEKQTLTEPQEKRYQATTAHQSPGLFSSSSTSGTYRRINNKLYSQLPTEDRGEMSGSEKSMGTDYTISEAATASSLSHDIDGEADTSTTKPISSQYSLIQRRDSDVSTCHSEEDILDEEGEDGRDGHNVEEPLESQYSVVTRENMDHVSEASDSEAEDSHTPSDADPDQEDGHKVSDYNPSGSEEQHAVKLYENIP